MDEIYKGGQSGLVVIADSTHVVCPGSSPGAGRNQNSSWYLLPARIDLQIGQ